MEGGADARTIPPDPWRGRRPADPDRRVRRRPANRVGTYDLPYRYRDAFIAAERDARTAGRGLWAGDTCDGNTTKPAG